jgi:hypothetical protein
MNLKIPPFAVSIFFTFPIHLIHPPTHPLTHSPPISPISIGETPVRVFFGVDFKSRKGGFDPSKKIEKEDIPTLEAQLKAAEETLTDVSREIEFARVQEAELREATGTI